MSRIHDQQIAAVRRRLRNAGLALGVVIVTGTVGFLILGRGRHGLIDALYMTMITLTTVGYGEIIPLDEQPWGRVFTMMILAFGLGIFLYFASTMTAFFVEGQIGRLFWRQRMRKAIAELKEHIIVCGDKVAAAYVLDELHRVRRTAVALVPPHGELPPVESPEGLLTVEGDPSDEEALREAGIDRAAGLVAAMESDRENVMIAITARQMNPSLRIVSMLAEPRNEAKLRRAGADAVVSPPRIGGLRMASEMIRPTVTTFLDQMLRERDRNLRVEEIVVGARSPAIDRPIGTLGINDMPGLLLLALVEPGGGKYTFKPDAAQLVLEGAVLIVMGGPEEVNRLRRHYGGEHYGGLLTTSEFAARAPG